VRGRLQCCTSVRTNERLTTYNVANESTLAHRPSASKSSAAAAGEARDTRKARSADMCSGIIHSQLTRSAVRPSKLPDETHI